MAFWPEVLEWIDPEPMNCSFSKLPVGVAAALLIFLLSELAFSSI